MRSSKRRELLAGLQIGEGFHGVLEGLWRLKAAGIDDGHGHTACSAASACDNWPQSSSWTPVR